MMMRSPSLIKIAVIIATLWVIFIYQQYLHTSTAPYDYRYAKPQFQAEFDPIRHVPICRDNVTRPTSSSTDAFVHLDGKIDETERSCQREFHRATDQRPDHVPGLTPDDYERSIAHVGNRYRIAAFVQKLIQSTAVSHNHQSPVTAVVCGGSITMGHGLEPQSSRYSDSLEMWMNEVYPTPLNNNDSNNTHPTTAFNPAAQSTYEYNYGDQYPDRHRVYFRGGHGANVRTSRVSPRVKHVARAH